MSQDKYIDEEAASSRLVRVLKKIKRKMSDGSVKEYEQAFRVKQAQPGDKYQANARPELAGSASRSAGQEMPPEQQPDDPAQGNVPAAPLPEPLPSRLVARVHPIPWQRGEEGQESDPIPPEVRHRFDPANKAARQVTPTINMSPRFSVQPGEAIFWGANEPDLINRLKDGRVIAIRSVGGESGVLLVKIEHSDGSRYKGYLRIEGLNDPYLYQTWGEEYDLDKDRGSISRRDAAAYELSKAVGLDDLVPPTVVRYDEFGDIDAILPASIIERRQVFAESIAQSTGATPDDVRKKLKGWASLQLVVQDSHGIDHEKWFTSIFQKNGKDEEQKAVLNAFYDSLPDDMRVAFLRAAALDFILWTADRHLLDLSFCREKRHKLHLIGNGLSFPHPKKTVEIYHKHGLGFLEPHPIEVGGYPLLWSDLLMLLAIRGGEAELALFDQVGAELALRLDKDRAVELVRCLFEHGLEAPHVAAALFRAKLLGRAARQIARDPFLVLRFFEGLDDPLMDVEGPPIVEFVNAVIAQAGGGNYDLAAEFSKKEEKNDSDQ